MKFKLQLIILLIICLVFSAVGCNGLEKNSDLDTNTDKTESIESNNENSSPNNTNSDVTNSQSKPESVMPDVTSSEPETEAVPITVKVGPYDIFDIHNSRGLSTKKSGFGYGVAKDGKPHSISVNNQKRFDNMKNIEALALDTKSTEKCMYLTFDCGYEYKNLTANVLDTLNEKGIKAAFFLTGDYAKKNHTLVQRMIDEGHIVGNHSYGHPSFPDISREKMANEIWKLEDYLKTNFNYSSKYFRFPSGEHSESALELVSSMGYRSIFWSLAHADWDTSKQPSSDNAVNTVTSRFHDGAVILLHTVSQANADGLAEMIDIAINQGYTFKTLDEYYN